MKKRHKIQPEADLSSLPIPAYGLHGLSAMTSPVLDDILGLDPISPGLLKDWGAKELTFARTFNFELPSDFRQALYLLEGLICEQMDVETCQIHLTSPTYGGSAFQASLLPAFTAPEQTCLSRGLVYDGRMLGQIRLYQPRNGGHFSLRDQFQLDLVLPYLAVHVQRLVRQQSLETHNAQHLEPLYALSAGLLKSSDQESILPQVLNAAFQHFAFPAVQYLVAKESDPQEGEVLYEIRLGGSSSRKLRSFSHAALEDQRRILPDYASWLSQALVSKGPLCISAGQLQGIDFGIPGIAGLYVSPVKDLNNDEPLGLICLLSNTAEPTLDAAALGCLQEMANLASQACSRALQVEASLAMATQDELTGLMTRRAYYQRFDAEMERARRHQTPLSVALIDVDHFKRLNDSYGHLSGDLVLKHLAGLFTQNLRKSDIICRFGGEEFAILLPDTTMKAAVELLERIRQNVAQHLLSDFTGQTMKVTISAGLAEVNTRPHPGGIHDNEMVHALTLADEQLYRAKGQGRNQVCHTQQNQQPYTQVG
jgi:diguanylate cyclase (GGDEF)-like protein